MKKSSVFVMIIMFIVSFFAITFFGLAPKDDQFRIRFTDAKITGFQDAESGEQIDYQEIQTGKSVKKILVTYFPQEKGILELYIKYVLTPDPSEVTTADAFEFTIDERGNGEFVGDDGNTYPYAMIAEEAGIGDLKIRKHAVKIYHTCKINLRMRTIDGSAHEDLVTLSILEQPSP